MPSEDTISPSYYGVIKAFGWRRVSIIEQNENLFSVVSYKDFQIECDYIYRKVVNGKQFSIPELKKIKICNETKISHIISKLYMFSESE